MTQEKREWSVVVVGGGHAGVEAALAAARLGCETLLITASRDALACMPCNPAIGGLAKSHLVSELDALGGEMGLNADLTGIQFRTLNASRGPAVRALRVQCDKEAYAARMRCVVESEPRLTVMEDLATGLATSQNKVLGVTCAATGLQRARAVVLTAGTALAGRIHIGQEITPGAGAGRAAADALAASLRNLDFPMMRLKTGTPPRLLASSIAFEKTEQQPGEEPPRFFSLRRRAFHVEHSGKQGPPGALDAPDECSTWNTPGPWPPGSDQLPCWLTHTNERTHQIVRDNLKASALYGGGITGTGVRYCPSLEDKVVKFSGAERHHLFLEPEGRKTTLIYPNGLSNSLPREIQDKMIRTIPALARAVVAAWGYAIEYDAIDPRELSHALESRRIQGLFIAGQLNGTTGYEEAAAQGFLAGVNAALSLCDQTPLILSRQDAYIGVMVDDLVTKGADEPYRMFTSRAERRLLLRQDNAHARLLPFADQLQISPAKCREHTRNAERQVLDELTRLASRREGGVALQTLLARPEQRYATLPGRRDDLPPDVVEQVEIRARYAGYLAQEERAAERARLADHMKIPDWMNYQQAPSLRQEAREKLSRVQPASLGQAARIPGITPADIAILQVMIRRGPPRE